MDPVFKALSRTVSKKVARGTLTAAQGKAELRLASEAAVREAVRTRLAIWAKVIKRNGNVGYVTGEEYLCQ